jgi:hypothetical protein
MEHIKITQMKLERRKTPLKYEVYLMELITD